MTAATHQHAPWPVYGHDWAVEHLANTIRHERMRHAYLITGPSSIGKTTLARAFAMTINCTGPNAPCGACRSCRLIKQSGHADLTLVEAETEGGSLKIDQVRELQQTLALRPFEGRYRVAILRRFHEANAAAANALLKTLEEPSPSVVLILTAESTDRLLPTIVSRCQPIHLRPVTLDIVRNVLIEKYEADPTLAQELAQLSGGRLGWAIRALQDPDEREVREKALDLLETALQSNRRERFTLVDKMSMDKSVLFTMLDFWQGFWRDVVLIASGSRATIANGDRTAQVQAIAQHTGPEAAEAALLATRRTIDLLEKNANTRLTLEVLMLDLPAP